MTNAWSNEALSKSVIDSGFDSMSFVHICIIQDEVGNRIEQDCFYSMWSKAWLRIGRTYGGRNTNPSSHVPIGLSTIKTKWNMTIYFVIDRYFNWISFFSSRRSWDKNESLGSLFIELYAPSTCLVSSLNKLKMSKR